MRLVLFDIDGTLLRSGGIGRRSMEHALSEKLGFAGSTDYHYDGKTDRQIVRDLLRLEGFAEDDIDHRMDDLIETYLSRLDHEVATQERTVLVLDGVLPLLDALERQENVVLGLLTGNVQRGARVKLAAAGIDPDRFRVNAFGSDDEHRPQLPAVAQRRAREVLGADISGERVVLIGDTPADIRCGEEIGARAIGVATGRYSVEQLLQHNPYRAFESLADTVTLLQAIMHA